MILACVKTLCAVCAQAEVDGFEKLVLQATVAVYQVRATMCTAAVPVVLLVCVHVRAKCVRTCAHIVLMDVAHFMCLHEWVCSTKLVHAVYVLLRCYVHMARTSGVLFCGA
jgi:hypothetical protein